MDWLLQRIPNWFILSIVFICCARSIAKEAWQHRVPESRNVSIPPTSRLRPMKRAIGYCSDERCEDFTRGVFVINPTSTFFCPACRQAGNLVYEKGWREGTSPDDSFKEVRLQFDYAPVSESWQQTAIVRDENLLGEHLTYVIQTPMVKTESRALKMAEAILANLNCSTGELGIDEIPRTTEIILSFDDPMDEFTRKLERVSAGWEEAKSSHRRCRLKKMAQRDSVED